MKRFTAILLTFCLILGLLPGVAYGAKVEEEEVRVLTKEDYVAADVIWAQITEAETDLYAKRAPANERTEALIAVVEASPYYSEGTLIRNGDFFSWETTDGVACAYAPAIREKMRTAKPLENYDASKTTEVLSFAKKGGSPAAENVYVIQPYYGVDDSFTEQYNEEAATIAADIGGICTTYRTTDTHIENIANAVEDGAVVFFDSHGTTDYSNPDVEDDYSSQANTSYFCIYSNTGLTSADYARAQGTFGYYYHTAYGGADTYLIDGTVIANHMDKNAPNSLVWIALCLGMATDGIQAPLRAKGVEVAYGYSQSVTFYYDYRWEESFWAEMLAGKTVASAAATMKEEVGEWDWCHASASNTLEEAQATYCAFPIFVSSEDTYPGHGNVDNLQTVKSTWTLFKACEHGNVEYVSATPPTCTVAGNTGYYRCTDCSICFSDAACTIQISQSTTVIPATGHSYDEGVQTTAPTCEAEGELLYTCATCGDTYTEAVLATGHSYVEGFCAVCGAEEPDVIPFEIGVSGKYVLAAYVDGEYYAMANVFPEANNKIAGTKITVVDGVVSYADAQPYVVTLQHNGDGIYTIKNDTVYLKYASGTNLTSATAAYNWKITAGSNGSWRITSTLSTARGVIFRAGSYMLFGGYSTANFATSTDYYDIEILPISSTLVTECAHSSTREETTKEVTCTEDGEISVYCADCGELLGTAPIFAAGHNYESVETTAPDCEAVGVMTYTCSNCGDSYTEEIPAIGHNYEGAETTAPTCENAGVMTYTCANCGDAYTEAISALGHTEETDPAVAATCTEDGLTEGSHCTVCGAVIVEQTTVPAIGHNYEGAETTAPTCENAGVMTYTCANCDDTYTEEIPAIGHSYVDGTCTNCGGSEPVVEPTVDESIKIYHTLDLASDISVTFAVPMSALEGYDSYYLECVLPEYEGNELTGTSTVTIDPVVSGNYYYFTLTGITAVRMGDMVDAVLHMTKADGSEYISNTDTYGVSTYAYAMLNSSSDTKMLALCADLLRYGAEAQSFKGYRTDALVDAAMTEEQRAYLSDTTALTFTSTDSFLGDLENPTITWIGKTLDLGSKVGMKFVFNTTNYTGDVANLSMKVTYEGSTGETKTVILTGAEAYGASGTRYSFTFYGLLASELRTVVEVAVYEGETRLGETLRYSAESYASKTAGSNLEALTRALFAYSDSAKAFFAE